MSERIDIVITQPAAICLALLVPPAQLRADLAAVIVGPPGPVGDAAGALLATNRLSEFAADPAAQADAQTHLGLGTVDPLAYYILAKA